MNDRFEWRLGGFEHLRPKIGKDLQNARFSGRISCLSKLYKFSLTRDSNIANLVAFIYDIYCDDSDYENYQKVSFILV